MTDIANDSQTWNPAPVRSPEQEQAAIGATVPHASELDIDDINPINAHLYLENRWQSHFERLRNEDPVHLNEIESAGRYWSITKYDDVRHVDGDWKRF